MVSVLREGYQIPFRDLLSPLARSPVSFPTYRPDSPRALALRQEVESMIMKGALEIVPDLDPGFYSRLFLVEKASGGWRPVIDLSPPQQMRTTNPIQDGDHRLSTPLGQKWRLPSLRGPERRVLPDPHPPLIQEVALFLHGRDGPSVQGTLLRTVNRPAGLHESFRNSVSLGPLPRSSTSPISGQLVGPGLLGDQSQAACPRTTLALSLPRHSDKRREVLTSTHPSLWSTSVCP